MAALQAAWEGQPDLTLPAFIGMLHNQGMGWATTDEELLAILQRIRGQHPPLVTGCLPGPMLITTTSPRQLVTLTDGVALVRSGDDPQRMPSVWQFSHFRPLGPGRPVVLADSEAVEHRLGVAELLTVLDAHAAPSPQGIRRDDIGLARWLVQFEAGVALCSVRACGCGRRNDETRLLKPSRGIRCSRSRGVRRCVSPQLAVVSRWCWGELRTSICLRFEV